MTKLIVRESGHEDIKTNMPSVSCGICGAVAQIPAHEMGVGHWDELYPEPGLQGYSEAQLAHDAELSEWSQEHDKTHSRAEHDAHAKKGVS